MTKQYQFARSVTVEGRAHKAGDVVPEAEIPAGCLASCLRLGHVVEHRPPEKSETKSKKNSASQRATKETVTHDR
jgi:hypothetical protein